MSKTDHLAKAKDYLAKGDDYYTRAAEEIALAMAADPTLTQQKVADRIGKHQSFVARLMSARINDAPVNWGSGSNKRDEVARKVLSDPEQRKAVIASLAPQEKEALAREISASVSMPEPKAAPEVRSAMVSIGNDADDLQVETASLIALGGRVGLLLSEGHEFKRLSEARREDLDQGLEDVAHVVEQLRAQIREQTPAVAR